MLIYHSLFNLRGEPSFTPSVKLAVRFRLVPLWKDAGGSMQEGDTTEVVVCRKERHTTELIGKSGWGLEGSLRSRNVLVWNLQECTEKGPPSTSVGRLIEVMISPPYSSFPYHLAPTISTHGPLSGCRWVCPITPQSPPFWGEWVEKQSTYCATNCSITQNGVCRGIIRWLCWSLPQITRCRNISLF